MHAIQDDWGIDDVITSEIRHNSYGEGEALTWWLAMLASASPNSVMIDAGAYTGLYSLIAAAGRVDVRVIAIEASVVTYGRLCQNILLNKFDTRINANHVAISNDAGLVQLSHGYGIFSMSSGESLIPTYEVDHKELVPSMALDQLLFQDAATAVGAIGTKSMPYLPLPPIGGIKIDVEGIEPLLLSGAIKTLSRDKPPLIIEILSPENLGTCRATLNSLGYEEVAQCEGQNYIFCGASQKSLLMDTHSKIESIETATFSAESVFSRSFEI